MIRVIVLAICAVLATNVKVEAARVHFQGTLTGYTNFGGPADPLGLGLAESFLASVDTAGNAITSGLLILTGGSGKTFSLTGGSVNIGAGTTDFASVNLVGVTGGVLAFNFNQAIGGTTQADFDTLRFVSGGATLGGGFLSPVATGFYNGSVTAIPEPASMGLLAAMVLGCGGYRWKNRARKVTQVS